MKTYQNIRLFSFLFAVLLILAFATFAQRNEKFTKETNGFTFVLDECKMSGGMLMFYFTVTSNDMDREIEKLWCPGGCPPKVVDNFGNQYGLEKFMFGNRERSANLVADVPTRMIITSEDFNSNASEVALLQLWFGTKGNRFGVELRKIPIPYKSGSNSNNNQGNSSISINNVAFRKNVYISTNGADDIPDNGTDCNNPSEITDGSLKKDGNCATDGVMGFQNYDDNQLMEVTVTINLQQTYNITKIRYNQGNVWGAGTWNADLMITPFGKIRTNAGSQDKGAWTEQTGSLNASRVQITFQKTKKKWNEDWLTIGEIEIIGNLNK